MTDGVEEMVYDSSTQLIRPVVARLAELAAKGKEEAEEELAATINKFVIGAGQNTDDASVGILYLPTTPTPDFSSLPDTKEKVTRNHEDTIRAVQMEWVPKVKHAQEILKKINCQKSADSDKVECSVDTAASSEETDVVETKQETPKETVPAHETKVANKETQEPEVPKERDSGKKVPLWAFLLMSGAFVTTAIALILVLI